MFIIILESVIKGKPILNLVCDLATAGRALMYCRYHDGYNVFRKPKSLYYNNGILEKRLKFDYFILTSVIRSLKERTKSKRW